jgi:hypothetical protein
VTVSDLERLKHQRHKRDTRCQFEEMSRPFEEATSRQFFSSESDQISTVVDTHVGPRAMSRCPSPREGGNHEVCVSEYTRPRPAAAAAAAAGQDLSAAGSLCGIREWGPRESWQVLPRD